MSLEMPTVRCKIVLNTKLAGSDFLNQGNTVTNTWQGVIVANARVWSMVQTGQITHGLLPAPRKKITSNLLALNRAGISVVTRMIPCTMACMTISAG